MNNDRIQQLIRFVQEEPNEPFNVYALAMEFLADRPEEAITYFERLLSQFPDYLPTYYHAAALYASRDERDRAARLYDTGIALAEAQHNAKTLLELQRARRAFDEEGEDW